LGRGRWFGGGRGWFDQFHAGDREQGVGAVESGEPFGGVGEEDQAGDLGAEAAAGGDAEDTLEGDARGFLLGERGGIGSEQVELDSGAFAALALHGLLPGQHVQFFGDLVEDGKKPGKSHGVEVHIERG
jgi:hypothetical protein